MSAESRKVLVVDDDQSAVAFVRAALETSGFTVDGAGDGLAGMSLAREERPDLIVLDVYMPRQVGFYTLRDLKADPRTKDIPVIMFTSVGKRLGITFSSQDIYDFLGVEPDVYLEKPIDPLFLRQVAEKLLGVGASLDGKETEEEQDGGNSG